MERDGIDDLSGWVAKAGIAGMSESDLLREFCERANAGGLPVSRALVIVDTLHPVHEGRLFRWRADQGHETEIREYGRTAHGGDVAEGWRRSPFFHMLQTGEVVLRRRLGECDVDEFPVLREYVEGGQTDWIAVVNRFRPEATIGEMDCIYSSWTTEAEAGFSDGDVAALKRLVPPLALAIKSASLARIAETLVETYLGRDAGRRVLAGRIERGVADRIEAALWFSDLRGYTAISGRASPDEILPLLNDYADAVISSVDENGGDVLKLIGDGVLAIFTADTPGSACHCALEAEELLRSRLKALNTRRREAGQPVTEAYLGLHVGEVFYGNIGSAERLDFTVIGPAVNEVSRIGAMCRSAERDTLVSSAFADALSSADRARLVSVGRYALRGVERPQELFTIDAGAAAPSP